MQELVKEIKGVRVDVAMASKALDKEEAARILGISVRSLDRYISEGAITYVTFGGSFRFRPESLDAFLLKHEGQNAKPSDNGERILEEITSAHG
jgi:excisionase family DNA binding protein